MRREIPECLKAAPGKAWSRPLDEQDVAVRLETDGVNDSVAQSAGYASTWDMACEWYSRTPIVEQCPQPPSRKRALAVHLEGMLFALPLAMCCLAMVFLKFSLWGGDVPGDVAAAVGAGTVASFIATGGIIQAMARQGLFYAGTGEFRMSEVVCWRWCGYGFAVLGVTATAWLILSALFGWLPHPLDWTAAGFHLCLGTLWLGTGVLYMLERSLWVSIAALTGIFVVGVLHVVCDAGLIPAQLAGISTAAALAFLMARHLLRQRSRVDCGRVHRAMPLRTLYLTLPYVAYGFLYYVFLFCDRILAWTAQTESSSLPLVFRGDYELPLDIALFAFVLQVGWVHSSMVRFYENLQDWQRGCEIEQARRFNREMQRFQIRRIGLFLPVALGLSLGVWCLAWAGGLFTTGIAGRVALFALAGYPFLVIGLWNVSLLFALSLPRTVITAISVGAACDAGVGYLLSRLLSYDWAVAGFTIGAFAFGAISSFTVLSRFRNLDYYNFASGA